MSHTDFHYPQSRGGLTLAPNSPWQVREDKDDYREALLALTDLITDKLTRAEALAWVLHGAKDYPQGAGAMTALVIAELIREALDANEKQWEKIRQANQKA